MNMNDRELLELAAKAAGTPINWTSRPMKDRDGYIYHQVFAQREAYTGEWNPLADDGAALRLAYKLSIDLAFDVVDGSPTAYRDRRHNMVSCQESAEEDGMNATRRAIVRAAAEIGKMK